MFPLSVLTAIAPPDAPPILSTATPQDVGIDEQRAIALQPILSPEAALQPQFSIPQMAQAIAPDTDGTGTVVTPDGNQIDITGGELSGDGANLFHSFQEFGLTAEQIANFIATPDIQNILSSVNGGNASIINGLLQVSGSNANLYLINPAGIILGPEGGIDLTGSFTATTADQVGFGDNWLDVLNPTEYEALTGTPDGFAFAGDAGTVLNLGDLTVDPGQSVTLLGGEVINLGTIEAPAGMITLAAIPSENLVRISQENQLLSLEITPQLTETGQLALNPLALPELLTGSSLANNDLTVVQNADGTVRLESPTAGATIELGSVIASGEIVTEGEQGGQIYLLGQQVSLLNADVNASGLLGGGDIRVGGDIQGQGQLPLATVTQIDITSTLSADALPIGDGGSLVVWGSELAVVDGLLTARGGTETGNGGFIETSGDRLELSSIPDASAVNGSGGTWLIDPTDITIVASGGDPFDSDSTVISATSINTALDSGMAVSIVTSSSGSDAGNITLETGATLEKTGGSPATLSLSAINDILLNDSVQLTAGGPLTLNLTADFDEDGSGAITASPGTRLESGGGNVSLSGADISVGAIDTTFSVVPGGSVTLDSDSNIVFESINTSSEASGPAGNVILSANGTVAGTGTVTSIAPPIAPPNTTIFTQGSGGDGTVDIQHDGGPNNESFAVGDAAVVNGTIGAIVTDSINSVLDSGTFPVQPNGGTDNPSPNVTITSVNTPPTLATSQQLSTAIDQPVDFTVADLNPTIADANTDITTLEVVSVPAGTLLQNGTTVQPGAVIAPTDTLQYIPPADTTGTFTAFTLQTSDGVSISASVDVAVDISDANGSDPLDPLNPTDPINFDTLDPTLGTDPLPFPELPPTEQTLIVGMPLAQSPQMEELSVLGMVLPESGFLIVDATAINAEQGSTLFPSSSILAAGPNTQEAPAPEGTPDTLAAEPNTQEAPAPEGTPEPGEPVEPGPGPLVPSEPPSDPPPQQEPASEGGTSDSGPTAESPTDSADIPSDSSEPATDDGSVALQPSEQADTTTSPTTPVAQGLKNCQAEAQGIQTTAASDRTQSLYASLIDCYESNLATATEQGDARWVGYSLNNLAISHFVIGDYLTALELHEQQLEQARTLNDRTQEGIALGGIGATYAALGDYATAIDFYEQSLQIMPVETAPQWKALTYRNLGNAYFAEKDYENAAHQQLTSLDISRGAGDTYGEMQAYGNLASTRAIQGQFTEAIALYEQGLELAEAIENDLEVAQLLLGISTTYAYQQDYEQAYRYSQDALAIARQLGASLGEGIALTNVGNALLYLERLTEAEQALFDAVSVWENVRAGLGTSDGFKVSIFETQLTAYRNLQEVLLALIVLQKPERGSVRR
ncbi:MAG: tetratricopeptide repeat protein [Cyanobacteria bacterium J06626_23]